MKIAVTIQKYDFEARKMLKHAGHEIYDGPEAFNIAEVFLVGIGVNIDKAVIDAAPYLKYIATATTGIDHIDVEYAQSKGIQVLRLEGTDLNKVTSTAELAFGLMLSVARHIPLCFEDVKDGHWNRELFSGLSLSEKTLGIVGLGRLGSMMARYGKAFGMRVIAYSPNITSSDAIEAVDFDTLLSGSDFVSIHTPLNDETQNMFDRKVFSKMKNTAHLINTARGAIVHEKDLIDALENGDIAGYAADVLGNETDFNGDASSHPLVLYSKNNTNVIITPHIGGLTKESRSATDIIITEKLIQLIG